MHTKEFITGLQHIGIPTNDLDATRSFYEALGFEAIYSTVLEKENLQVVFLQLGDLTLEVYQNKLATLRDGSIDHIALNVENVEKLYEHLVKKGHTILSQGVEFLPFWDNGVKFFIIEGPNKERVEFNQRL